MTETVDRNGSCITASSLTGQPLQSSRTEQPLQSSEEPGDHLKLLDGQHPNGHAHENSENIVGYREPTIGPPILIASCDEENRANEKQKKFIMIIIICLLIVIIVLILGIAVVGYKFHLAARKVTSTYSGMVTTKSPIYSVTRNDRHRYEEVTYRYKQIVVTISTSGLYRFECDIVDLPSFVYVGTIDLYRKSFNTTNLTMNRLPYKYSGKGIHKNFFGVSLRSRDYILVVSMIDAYEKLFSILITGPAKVTFS